MIILWNIWKLSEAKLLRYNVIYIFIIVKGSDTWLSPSARAKRSDSLGPFFYQVK